MNFLTEVLYIFQWHIQDLGEKNYFSISSAYYMPNNIYCAVRECFLNVQVYVYEL